MEMVINGFALNMASEEAIAPTRHLFSWIVGKVTSSSQRLSTHVLAATSLEV